MITGGFLTENSRRGSVTLFRKQRQVSHAFSLNCRHVKDDKNFVSRKKILMQLSVKSPSASRNLKSNFFNNHVAKKFKNHF
jgi:hypothetical protein